MSSSTAHEQRLLLLSDFVSLSMAGTNRLRIVFSDVKLKHEDDEFGSIFSAVVAGQGVEVILFRNHFRYSAVRKQFARLGIKKREVFKSGLRENTYYLL
jgi:hypothetical protein